MKKKLIIDTDPGHDDALAILMLVKSKLFDIRALTIIAGNSGIQNTANNARHIIDLLECNIPIHSGEERPLKRELIVADVHGKGGMDGVEVTKTEKLTNSAPKEIIKIVRENPHEVTILLLGPQTNLAKAFLIDPGLPKLIKEVVIMGGAIQVPGNKNRVGEFNIFVDPDAAKIVMESSVKKTMIPLDVCNDISLSLSDFNQLKKSDLYIPIISMMREYIKGIRKYEKTQGALMYDPLAAYYLINRASFSLMEMDIRIETESELTRGMTVADRRKWGDKKPNINVAIKINKTSFKKDFIRILKGNK